MPSVINIAVHAIHTLYVHYALPVSLVRMMLNANCKHIHTCIYIYMSNHSMLHMSCTALITIGLVVTTTGLVLTTIGLVLTTIVGKRICSIKRHINVSILLITCQTDGNCPLQQKVHSEVAMHTTNHCMTLKIDLAYRLRPKPLAPL